jgi:hypothetical protein
MDRYIFAGLIMARKSRKDKVNLSASKSLQIWVPVYVYDAFSLLNQVGILTMLPNYDILILI